MNKKPNSTAFIDIKTSNSNFDKLLEDKLHINEDELFDDYNFGIDTKKLHFEIRKNNPLHLITNNIIDSFKKSIDNYHYEMQLIRRELTSPHEGNVKENLKKGVANEGLDNIENDLIVNYNDIIISPDNVSYKIIERLGKGSSGQVFKCVRENDKKELAIKIIKNKKTFTNMSLRELRILEFLNTEVDPQDLSHIIRKYDHFMYKNHMCIIFELLNHNLLELLMKNNYSGLTLKTIGFILKQILEGIYQFQKINIIHCDLKPENILIKLKKTNDINIKITDFGSACFKSHTIASYIQSRYYRAPEVLITHPYSSEIDMWSTGCVAAELFIGNPLFPGCNEHDQLLKIESVCGYIPQHMVQECGKRDKFFVIDKQTKQFRLKTKEEYYSQYPNEKPKVYYEVPLKITSLNEFNRFLKTKNEHDKEKLSCFIHFLKGLLNIDPQFRWNAKIALRHPFITGEKFTGTFNPQQTEVSMMLFPSLETTFRSEREMVYNSMILENLYNNNSCNTSLDCSLYRPNVGNIPLRTLKELPFMLPLRVEDLAYKKKGIYNKFEDQNNNTFMITSFDKLNASANEEFYFHNYKIRQIKDKKKKTSKFKNKPSIDYRHYNKYDIAIHNMSMSFEKKRRERSNSDYNNNIFSMHGNNNIVNTGYGSFKSNFSNNLNNSYNFRNNISNNSLILEKNGNMKNIYDQKSSMKNRDYKYLERIDSVQVIEDEENQDN